MGVPKRWLLLATLPVIFLFVITSSERVIVTYDFRFICSPYRKFCFKAAVAGDHIKFETHPHICSDFHYNGITLDVEADFDFETDVVYPSLLLAHNCTSQGLFIFEDVLPRIPNKVLSMKVINMNLETTPNELRFVRGNAMFPKDKRADLQHLFDTKDAAWNGTIHKYFQSFKADGNFVWIENYNES